MIRRTFASLAGAALVGCSTPYAYDGTPVAPDVIAGEAAKLAGIRPGMTEAQVVARMGSGDLLMFDGRSTDRERKPFLTMDRTLPNGWKARVVFYRSRIAHSDGICTLDETTAVILLNGKVDSLVRGDRVDDFLSGIR